MSFLLLLASASATSQIPSKDVKKVDCGIVGKDLGAIDPEELQDKN